MRMAKPVQNKSVIGRAELLDVVDFSIEDVPAKVDTGAYRSAIHADNIRLSDDGVALSFRLLGGHPLCGNMARDITVQDFRKVWVANSFGHGEERYAVRLRVKLGTHIVNATFSLADRSKKVYPVLLGRKLLNNRFLVDTSQSGVDRAELKKRHNIIFPMDEEEGR